MYTKGVCISQACRDESIVSLFFSLPQYILHSTSTYQAPYNEIIKRQTSHIYIYIYIQFKMTKMKHAWFPVTLSFVLTHSSDRFSQQHLLLFPTNIYIFSLWKTPRKFLMFNFADLNGIDRELNMEHYMSARRYGISLRMFSWMSRVTLASLSEWICWFLDLPWVYSIKGNLAQPIYYNATKTIRKKNIEHLRLYLYYNLTMSR